MIRLLLIFLISLIGVFSSFSQSITVTSPNGGEVWAGCTQKNITWSATSTSGFYSIDYSTDGGTNWTSVTSSLSTTAGTFAWTVPNINSSNCIVRVKDSNTPATVDQSNSTFTITAPLILTSPNGGEKWVAGTTKSITWAATGTSNRYKIEYSTNSGTSWNTITSNTYNTTGIYNWNVVNSPSTTALLRVTDYYTACMTDKSDNLFEIKPPVPTLTLTYPNGYQTLYSGKAYTIQWSSTNLTSNLIALDYSTDSGSTWTPIVTGISNSGSHSWTVPSTPSTSCLVKVKAVGTTYKDSSNNHFTIKNPHINVLAPNGGENWQGCNSYSIRWAHGGSTNNRFTIQYSTNNGASWSNIATNVYQSSTTNSSYTWSVPNTIQGSARVRVVDYSNSLNKDESDSTFNLSKNTSIIVTSPSGGESWEAGKTKSITWVDNNLSRFNVYYSSNNGSSYTRLVYATYANSLNWSVPNNPGSSYKVKVEDYYNNCKSDESDSTFTVTAPTPYITVTAPNGNSVYPFQSYSIRWSSAYLTSAFVKIEYSTDSGSTWNVIQNVTNNDGAETWTVPNVISTKCFVRVSEYGNSSLNDINDSPFTIAQPYITLNSPNGGETWKGCEVKTISWSVGGGSGTYRLEYSLDSGSTWNYIINRSSTSYSWTIPAKLSSTKGLIRVRDLSRGIADTSNGTLSFIPNTDIIVTSANGGESWEAATTKSLTWVDNSLSRFNVYYSSNNGGSYTRLVYATYANALNWSVPNNPGTNYKIKVEDYYNNCHYDESDSTFTVTAPQPRITVTAPNGGTLYPQNSYTVRWTSAYLNSSFVNIDFSSDSGQTWTAIATSTSNDGSESWTIPNSISTKCFVRVSESGSASVFDWGNQFTIAQPYLTLNSPNGGESWKGCESKSISWSVGGGSGTYRLEYSLDSGSTWIFITNRSSTSYTWTIPAKLSSTKAKIRVRDLSRSLIDECNSVFQLIPNTDIIVTAPNGGESWEVGNTKTLSWVDNNLSRFNVYYSANNGGSYTRLAYATYANSMNWSVPNNPSSNYKIKVEDYYNNCKYDESDSLFVVTPPVAKITVTSPNGGTYYPFQAVSIRWTGSYLNSAFVKIEYSSDSGSTWNVISNVTNNDGAENWTIPNVISTKYLIRVSEYGTPSVNDTSSSFSVNAPFISLNSPNGAETWKGCEAKTISWTVGGGSGTYRLEYSLDSGSTWVYIANRSGSSYNWTVPAKLSSSKAMIRIRDLSRGISDMSNNVFNLVPNTDIIVTSPNGGESWEAATTKSLTWVDNSLSRFNVYYSSNNGASYTRLVYATYANSLNWSVPNNPGFNYKVKVEDYYNNCHYDESDAKFTVTAPQPRITVTAPNGGTVYPQTAYTIRWTSAYLNSSFVNIDFSSDSGQTWSAIATSTNNDGSEAWTIPSTISSNCFVRVSEVGAPTVNDWGSRFTIAQPFLSLNSPNGGELWKGCSAYTISWSVGGGSGTYRLEYSLDSGQTWVYIANRTGSAYSWTVPTHLSSTKALMRVRDLTRNLADESNSTFTFQRNQDIIISTPNGGESIAAGTTKQIQWVDNNVSRANVYYSTNNGTSYTRLVYATYGNALNWSVPNTPGSNYRVKVEDYYNNCKYDISDSTFTVLPPVPYLTLTYPNGANTLYQGQAVNVRWTSGHLTSPYVRLDYSLDSGLTWNTISNVTNNDGIESWTLPNVSTTKAMVRVSEYGNSTMADISNATFSIQPSIVLTAPNGGVGQPDYRGCTVTSIKWNAGGTSRYYRIEYSLNGGSTWVSINANYYTSSSSPTYNWTMPNTATNNAIVRVRDRNDLSKSGQSVTPFTISAPILLNVPNQGGTYYVSDTMNINWTSNGTSNYYNIDYSTNGGTSWTSIAYNHNTSGNSYAWIVPGTISNNCKIRITDNITNCKQTQSIIPFKIVSGSKKIVVTSPSGGESWAGCSNKSITWTDNGSSAAYKIQYSANNGQSWTTIQNSYATSTKSYSWSVPSTVGSAYLVRVSDASDSTKTDQSDSAFDVTNSVKPVVSAIGNTTLCNGNSVTLSVDKTANIAWYPGGLKTQTISVTTPGSYYVLLSDSNGCTIQSNSITITSGTPPAAPTITASGPTKFCLGGSVILSTNQTSNIKWYPGGQTSQTITATQGGAYTVTYTAANGCSTPSLAKVITTNSIPVVNRTQSSTCLGDTLALSSNSATGNYWFPSGDTTQTIRVTSNGNYSVQVTDTNNCVATSQVDSVTFEARPAPPVVTALSSLSFCKGGSVKLVSSPTNNISWTNGVVDSIVTIDSAATIKAIYTNSGGCQSFSSAVTTTLLASPSKPVISAIGDTSFCQGDSVTLVSSGNKNKWSTNDTSTSILVKTSGYYSVQETGTNGCTANSDQVFVSVSATPSKPVVSANSATTFCSGDSVILSSNIPTGNIWSNGDSGTFIVVKTAGSFTVKYSNAQGCEAVSNAQSVSVNSAPSIPIITVNGSTSFCDGDSITLSSSYSGKNIWSTGDSTQSIVVKNSGIYSLEAKGVNGCKSGSVQKSILVNTTPTSPVITLSDTGKLCIGDSIVLTSSVANGNIWSTGDSSSSVTIKRTGTYTVKTKNSNGCESPESSKTIVFGTRPAMPTISAIGSTTFCQGDSVVLVSSSALNNSWSNGATTQSIVVKSAGGYSVEVGNSSGCSNNSTASLITVNPIPSSPVISIVGDTTFCQGDSVILTSSKALGNSWNTNDSTRSLVVKSTGLFNVSYKDSKGCEATSSTVSITANPLPAKPSVHVSGNTSFCDGDSVVLTSSVLNGNKWSNGDTNKVVVAKISGNYSVSLSNSFGCKQSSAPISITRKTRPAVPQLLVTGDTAFCSGDSAVVRSNYSNNLKWSNGDSSATRVIKNSAFVSVLYTATNGCAASSKTQKFTVHTNPSAPVITALDTTTFCSGDSVVLKTNSLSNNLWSNGDTTKQTVVKTGGNYSITAKNQHGCEATSPTITVVVHQTPTLPSLTLIGDTILCQGDSAILSSSFSNGNKWSNGSVDQSLNVKSTGNYSVKYTDANGCFSTSKVQRIVVNPIPTIPTISNSGSLTFCDGSTVTLTSSASSNNKWSNGDTTNSILVSNTGNYSVKANNQYGCESASNNVFVKVNPIPASPFITVVGDTTFCNGDSVIISTNYSKGIVWSNNDTASSINVKTTGFYKVTYTDTNGCKSVSKTTKTVMHQNPAKPTILNSGPLTFCDGASVSLTSSASSNNKWSNGDTSNALIVKNSGNYSVKASNQFGCETTSNNVLVQVNTLPAVPNITVVGDTSFCNGDSVMISTNYTNGIVWSNNDTTPSINVKSTGFYKVTYTDSNGCKSVSKTTSTVMNQNPTIPTVLASGPLTFCDGSSVTLSSSSSSNNKWSSGDSSNSVVVKKSGNYSVKVYNQFGCEANSINTFVKVNQLPSTPTITASGPTSFCQGDSVILSSSSLANNKWSTTSSSSSIIVKSAGIYSVKVVDTNGCESPLVNQSVSVNAAPIAPVISAGGSLGFCQGDSVVLRSNTLSGNKWNTGDTTQTIVVKGNGIYGVKVTNANNCEALSNLLTVSVGNRPSTPTIISSGKKQFCQGDSVILISSSSATNVWSTGDSSNSITVKSPGKISLKVLDNGCYSNEATESITVWLNPNKPIITTTGDSVFCDGDSVVLHSSYSQGNIWSHGSSTASNLVVKIGGSFYVTYTDTNGCKSESEVLKTRLLPVPQAPYISPGGQLDLCDGDTIILRSDLSSGIKWNYNQSPVDSQIITKAGSYYVDLTDANGCTAQSNTVTVSLLPVPTAPVITRIDPDLQSSVAAKYQWLVGGVELQGAIGRTYRPLQNGAYQVMIFDGNGCRALSEPETFNSVGLEEMNMVESMKLYPNPSNGEFTMDLVLSELKELDLLIYNMNGQVVHQENIKPSLNEISRNFKFSDLPSGIYQFELRSEDYSHSERITINK